MHLRRMSLVVNSMSSALSARRWAADSSSRNCCRSCSLATDECDKDDTLYTQKVKHELAVCQTCNRWMAEHLRCAELRLQSLHADVGGLQSAGYRGYFLTLGKLQLHQLLHPFL
jgi:hypothetical protein